MLPTPVPVTVVTGFLGAGKTTLVNALLASRPQEAIGVVVNEVGEIGIDGELIDAEPEAVVEIRNGCVCCTVRADLVGSVLRLLDRAGAPPLQRLIVETSGLADPAPVLQSFLADAALRERTVLESVVTAVDAVHAEEALADGIGAEQVACADVLVLTKAEGLDAAARAALRERLQQLNPAALITEGRNGATAEPLLGVPRFSLDELLRVEPGLLDDGEHAHEHDASLASVSLEEAQPLDGERFNRWMNRLVRDQGADLLRMKGLLQLQGEGRRFHFHGVHMLLDCRPGRRWPEGAARTTRLVFIGRGLDAQALAEGLRGCHAAAVAQGAPA